MRTLRHFASLLLALLAAGVSLGLVADSEAAPIRRGAEGSGVPNGPFTIVLGVAQDGGYPQAGTPPGPIWEQTDRHRLVASLGVVDPRSGKRWLVDATPDFRAQLQRLDRAAPTDSVPGLDGIFLTHGHMGHYSGLLHLGREVISAHGVPVWAMPRMERFLKENAPWEQLVSLDNIRLQPLRDGVAVALGDDLSITPISVPHRDEYTETVGFVLRGSTHSVLFIPDIDKWERWDTLGTHIETWIAQVDVAYLDGTFFAEGEIPGRAMSEIPHPFIAESLFRFAALPASERSKVRFLHLNRSNPALDPESAQADAVREAGCRLAEEGERVAL
ncbi:MAG: MBL fold metallo-hydrolase [Thermoanaerobaculia bacterium]|nr:MBL fold metallo-hydrolase [Thermoanaerobaculia bacterium]